MKASRGFATDTIWDMVHGVQDLKQFSLRGASFGASFARAIGDEERFNDYMLDLLLLCDADTYEVVSLQGADDGEEIDLCAPEYSEY